jgi:hypothetical protein
MKAIAVGVVAIATCACGGSWSPVASSGTEQEALAVSETARAAAVLGVKVDAKLTDSVYWVKAGTWGCEGLIDCKAAAWYTQGTVMWYRPWVVKQDANAIAATAAHEVCHAIEYNHNAKHAECVRRVG